MSRATPKPAPATAIEAVTFDFYNTLVHHRTGRGRGAMLMEYLREQGLESDPWEHQVLYDVFARHHRDYSPRFEAEQKRRYLCQFTERLFERLRVRAPEGAAATHATTIWALLGPTSLGVYPDVGPVLRKLRDAGISLGVVSNWQCGLHHFCTELGIADTFDVVVSSAEVGWEKPSPEIFLTACDRLGVTSDRVLHVGDTVRDDIEGARAARLHALLVRRDSEPVDGSIPRVTDLSPLPDLLGLSG